MQVYDITARFSRTIQVREYEPASSELTIKAQLADGEKAEDAIKELFALASGEVHISLGLAKDTKLPPRGKAAAAATTTAKPAATNAAAPAEPAKTTAKPAADKTVAPAKATDDIPGEGAPAAKTTAAAASATSDIPGETAPAATTAAAAPAETGDTTPAELSKWIGEQVRTGKVTSVAITGLYPKFGIARFADLKPEKCSEAKAAVQALIDKSA